MSVYFDSTPRAIEDGTNVAVQLAQASLGGTIAVRVILDDAVLTSKEAALHHLRIVEQEITKRTWPVS